MASRSKRLALVRHDDPASSIYANRAGPFGWYPEGLPHSIHENSDDEQAEKGDPTSFGDRRKKRRLNYRAVLQFIDSMGDVEGESNSGPDADEEEENNTTASDNSFIVGDDIFQWTYLLYVATYLILNFIKISA